MSTSCQNVSERVVWERQNLFPNENLIVRFRNPIDLVRVGRVGDYFRLEGLVERRCDRSCVLSDSQLVELHALPEARDK